MRKLLFLFLFMPLFAAAQAQCAQTHHTDGSMTTICTQMPYDTAAVEFMYADGEIMSFHVAFNIYPNGIHLQGFTPNNVPFSQFLEYSLDNNDQAVYTYEYQGEEYGMYFNAAD